MSRLEATLLSLTDEDYHFKGELAKPKIGAMLPPGGWVRQVSR